MIRTISELDKDVIRARRREKRINRHLGSILKISAASEESLSSDLGEFVEHCTPASGESSTTAEEGESGDEEADAKDEVAMEDVIWCK